MTIKQGGTPVGNGGAAYAAAANAMNAASPSDASSMPNVAQLSPDSLMAFLQFQLQGNDQQVGQIQSKMEQEQQEGKAINALNQQLNTYSSGINSGDPGAAKLSPDQVNQFRNATDAAYDTAIQAAGPSTPDGQALAASKAKFDSGFGPQGNTAPGQPQGPIGDNDLAVGDIASLTTDIKNIQSNSNTDSQMDMINLQSLVSQRQSFIQLATNMMQSLNDGTKSVVSNVGH